MTSIKVGDKVRSLSEPHIGVGNVLFVEDDDDVRVGCSNIITVDFADFTDDWDADDLEVVK